MLFFAATPVLCEELCTCHYNHLNRANVFTCSGSKRTTLPSYAPMYTNWIEVTNSNLGKICGVYPYLQSGAINITGLNLKESNVFKICMDTLDSILLTSHLKWVNLAQNNLTRISEKLQSRSNHLERLWLAGNPIQCDCDMTWMIDWVGNATTPSGGRLVQDYQDVMCGPGLQAGTPIWKLDRVKMGCFPQHLPPSTIIILGAYGGFVVLGLVVISLVYKNRILVRWFVYKHFGKLVGVDSPENLDGMEYDAFLSYRYVKIFFLVKFICFLYLWSGLTKRAYMLPKNRPFSDLLCFAWKTFFF